MGDQHSVIVFPDDTYSVRPGDWTRVASDGARRCACVSVHDSWRAANHARKQYERARAADNEQYARDLADHSNGD